MPVKRIAPLMNSISGISMEPSEKKTMRTIAIVLGDNDFGMTFMPLLETLYNAIQYNGELSEDCVRAFVADAAISHYMAFQRGSTWGQSGYGTIEHTEKYLKKAKVLFDDEAEADIATRFQNGEAWYLEISTGKVYSY